MTRKRETQEPKGFTDRELDIMSVLWREGSGTVTEVREALGEKVGYTTVLKMLQILEEKGAVGHEQEGRAYRYFPLVESVLAGAGAHADREQDLPRFRRTAAGHPGGGPGVHRRGDRPDALDPRPGRAQGGRGMITWMVYAAVVGGVVAVGGWACERLSASGGRPRRIAWLAALTLAVLIPLTGGLRRPTAPVVVTGGEAPEISEPVTEARWTIVPQLPLPASRDTTRTANVVWGAGSAAALAVLGTLLLVVARARRRWDRERVDGTDVYVSRRFGPALVGVTRPRVVLPAWVLGLEAVARAAIVRHELEHARARDHLALLYAGLVLAAFPWSPAIWWMCRRLRAAVEIDCDQRVIASGIGVADYGAVLLDAGSRSHARWGFAPGHGPTKESARTEIEDDER